ncbi:hypothetical protein Bbelb_226530 [Branchiostoma belcheri]|nr:hypothetical protein Bbelb_226530 [Branchiostoma belcheri]
MKLFVCMLLVTIVVMATLIDDSEGWRRRRRRRRSGLQADTDADSELREVMEEARALLEELNEQPEQLNTREMGDMDVENLLADQEGRATSGGRGNIRWGYEWGEGEDQGGLCLIITVTHPGIELETHYSRYNIQPAITRSSNMKLFVCMLLVTIVVMATLIDDSEGWRRRRRRRRSGLQADTDADSDLREVMEEARALLEELNEQPEQLDTRKKDDMNVENLLADQEVFTRQLVKENLCQGSSVAEKVGRSDRATYTSGGRGKIREGYGWGEDKGGLRVGGGGRTGRATSVGGGIREGYEWGEGGRSGRATSGRRGEIREGYSSPHTTPSKPSNNLLISAPVPSSRLLPTLPPRTGF